MKFRSQILALAWAAVDVVAEVQAKVLLPILPTRHLPMHRQDPRMPESQVPITGVAMEGEALIVAITPTLAELMDPGQNARFSHLSGGEAQNEGLSCLLSGQEMVI